MKRRTNSKTLVSRVGTTLLSGLMLFNFVQGENIKIKNKNNSTAQVKIEQTKTKNLKQKNRNQSDNNIDIKDATIGNMTLTTKGRSINNIDIHYSGKNLNIGGEANLIYEYSQQQLDSLSQGLNNKLTETKAERDSLKEKLYTTLRNSLQSQEEDFDKSLNSLRYTVDKNSQQKIEKINNLNEKISKLENSVKDFNEFILKYQTQKNLQEDYNSAQDKQLKYLESTTDSLTRKLKKHDETSLYLGVGAQTESNKLKAEPYIETSLQHKRNNFSIGGYLKYLPFGNIKKENLSSIISQTDNAGSNTKETRTITNNVTESKNYLEFGANAEATLNKWGIGASYGWAPTTNTTTTTINEEIRYSQNGIVYKTNNLSRTLTPTKTKQFSPSTSIYLSKEFDKIGKIKVSAGRKGMENYIETNYSYKIPLRTKKK